MRDDRWPDAYSYWSGEYRNEINYVAASSPVPSWVMRPQDHEKRALRLIRRIARRLRSRGRA